MVDALLALTMLTAQPTMDLSPWEPTPNATVEFVEILTYANPTETTTMAVEPTLTETTVSLMGLAKLALPTLIAEPWMEDKSLANPDATLQLEFADLAKLTLIALLPPKTAAAMEVATPALPNQLTNNVVLSMVVKFLINPTAILSPTHACPSVPLMTTVLMSAFLTATLIEVAASNVPLLLIALLETGEELSLAARNAMKIPCVLSRSLVNPTLTALLELLPALCPNRNALSACLMLTALEPLLLVPPENRGALSVSMIITVLEKTRLADLTKAATMEPLFSASLGPACSLSSPLSFDFNE